MPLWHQLTWWTLAFPFVMIVATLRHDIFLLNWIHVLSGALWTGADLFMGFILGPVLRMLDMGARTALIAHDGLMLSLNLNDLRARSQS